MVYIIHYIPRIIVALHTIHFTIHSIATLRSASHRIPSRPILIHCAAWRSIARHHMPTYHTMTYYITQYCTALRCGTLTTLHCRLQTTEPADHRPQTTDCGLDQTIPDHPVSDLPRLGILGRGSYGVALLAKPKDGKAPLQQDKTGKTSPL